MRFGISAAALVIDNNRVLLVHHREPGIFDFWLPPGGKVQGGESIFDCARREVHEETGLQVELGQVLYIQEFVEPGYHFIKCFILATSWSGELSLSNRDADEDFLVGAGFFSQVQIQHMQVFPEVMQDKFWQDFSRGIRTTHYIGLVRNDHADW